jgi:hypothetical protein
MRRAAFLMSGVVLVLGSWLAGRAEDGVSPFTTHETCALCHDETERGTAMRDAEDRNVAPVDLWRSSMMANAARDPLWRGVVALEAAATPSRAQEIESVCLRCHAPMAAPGTRLADLVAGGEPLALAEDGVSCTVCHQVRPEGLGTPGSFSGRFRIGDDAEIYGPHVAPFANPMRMHTIYTPTASEHVLDAALCGTCHTLYTDALGADGEATGARLAEQTPYLEWLNSAYATGPAAATCQDCHLPTVDVDGSPIRTRIAHNPGGRDFPPTSPRAPFGRHVLVGGNALTPKLLRAGGTAPADAFDETLARVQEQLASAARIEVTDVRRTAGRLRVDVRVENLTGHRLPTAHPTRRVWLALEALDEQGRVLFASGAFDARGRLVGADGRPLAIERGGGPLAPHRDRIEGADQVALYEARMADAAGRPTWLLTRGAVYAKDDRLPPRGWRADGPWPDETRPKGVEGDGDFGAGSDVVHYDVPLDLSLERPFVLRARLLHQTVGARWIAEWIATGLPEAESLRTLLEGADLGPSELARTTLRVEVVDGVR